MVDLEFRCEAVARYILPVFRSMVAKRLIEEYDFTQVKAAEKLGTTQAAISQYIHSKRGSKRAAELEESLPAIQSAAGEIAKGIATGEMNTDEVVLSFCRLCKMLQKEESRHEHRSIKHISNKQ